LTALLGMFAQAEVNVFDKPVLSGRHLRLLDMMNASHARNDFEGMEAVCRQGVRLGTADALWNYNLACAQALQGNANAALAALEQAVEQGFADAEHARLDPDLAALRDSDDFKTLLKRMERLQTTGETGFLRPMRPDASGTALQTSSNTVWSFELGVFQAFIARPDAAPTNAYRGPEAETIARWIAEGTAASCVGLLYANRDGGVQPLDVSLYPGLVRLAYDADMTARNLHIGLPNTLYSVENGAMLLPVIGHSSMGYINSLYGRSQPRALYGDPLQVARQSVFLLGNQLFFYPVFGDYDALSGDLFPAITPYTMPVAGGVNAERLFVDAAFAALSALRPETRAELTRTGLLMPALQMLFRASQRTLRNPRDYLTVAAHPTAFRAADLDTSRLVHLAHALTTNDLPPIVVLSVQNETQMRPDIDFFDAVRTERLFDSPLAIARVFRGAARTRTLDIRFQCMRGDARIHWVVLRGDPAKVTFAPCRTNSAVMSLTVAHHEPFDVKDGSGNALQTSRVDIGVIAETPAGFSAPSYISFYMLGNERRVYAPDGRIESIDYSRHTGRYVDPLLSFGRHWKDVYRYDARGNLTGWFRRRGLSEDAFTAYGHKVVATDSLGRASKAHLVRYMSRSIKTDGNAESFPDLAEVDMNQEVRYSYASDDDFVGQPDLASVSQETEPPAEDP